MPSISVNFLLISGLCYVTLLFVIAHRGDRGNNHFFNRHPNIIYSLSLAVYCSSWTFFGAVGTARLYGWEFFAIYLGPILLFLFGTSLIRRTITISKKLNITTISDFISARFGKNRTVAVLVTLIAVVGSLPYISLQLRAIAMGYLTVTSGHEHNIVVSQSLWSDTAFYTAILLAIFAILFGTRQLDATEQHRGMIQAIAFESVVKILAISVVGIYACVLLYQFMIANEGVDLFDGTLHTLSEHHSLIDFLVMTMLSTAAIIVLPRQFQVVVVEPESTSPLQHARWFFPLYLVIISIIVVPIAISASLLLTKGLSTDLTVLTLPLSNGNSWVTMIALLGGFSAATSMVIMATVSLSTMVSNDIVLPLLIRGERLRFLEWADLNKVILYIRRLIIVVILIGSYGYYVISDQSQALANIGLTSFAAMFQLVPPFLAALYWKKANATAVICGLCVGFSVWLYCLILPTVLGPQWFDNIPLLSSWLHPHHLFGVEGISPLTHGVLWSGGLNLLTLIVVSYLISPSLIDRIQTATYFSDDTDSETVTNPTQRSGQFTTIEDAHTLSERILGPRRCSKLFNELRQRGLLTGSFKRRASRQVVEEIERAIAAVIGASLAHQIVAKTLLGENVAVEDLVMLMDETSQEIRFNQRLLQATFNHISQGICVIDNNHNVVAWNEQYMSLFNLDNDVIYEGCPIDDIFEFEAKKYSSSSNVRKNYIALRQQHLITSEHIIEQTLNAHCTHIKSIANAMPGGGYVITYTDISKQIASEKALRESEASVRTYTDSLPLMICFVDSQGHIRFANKAYQQTMVTANDQLIEASFEDHLPCETVSDKRTQEQLVKQGKTAIFTASRPTPRGETYYEVRYIPNVINNITDGYYAIYQDITKRISVEKKLLETNETLEQRVLERTHDLEQLNRQLREVTISKTRFLAAASHDLLQPINAAKLFTHCIPDLAENTPGQIPEVVKNIDTSLSNANNLLRALLDISKLDAGSMTAELEKFDLYQLLSDIDAEMQIQAQQKSIALTIRRRHVLIHSDRRLLHSILQNLVSNAIRYTNSSGRILVGCRVISNDQLRIDVIDTGIGISKQDLPLIFNEFHRVNARNDRTSRNQESGLGLGLSITKRIADLLQHPVQVESKLGHGSRFSITLPVVSWSPTSKPKAIAWDPSNKLTGLSILVLDNDPAILEGMTMLLQSWDCKTTCVDTIEAAINEYQRYNFDIVLADYRLDETRNGLDFLIQLRQVHQTIVTVLITAEQDPQIKTHSLQNDINYLSKPIEPTALKTLLRHALKRAEKHRVRDPLKTIQEVD